MKLDRSRQFRTFDSLMFWHVLTDFNVRNRWKMLQHKKQLVEFLNSKLTQLTPSASLLSDMMEKFGCLQPGMGAWCHGPLQRYVRILFRYPLDSEYKNMLPKLPNHSKWLAFVSNLPYKLQSPTLPAWRDRKSCLCQVLPGEANKEAPNSRRTLVKCWNQSIKRAFCYKRSTSKKGNILFLRPNLTMCPSNFVCFLYRARA